MLINYVDATNDANHYTKMPHHHHIQSYLTLVTPCNLVSLFVWIFTQCTLFLESNDSVETKHSK